MIKVIVTILFKSSAAIKIIFITLFTEMRFLFKSFSDTILWELNSLNYYILQPICLVRFQEIRDYLYDNLIIIFLTLFFISIIYLISKRNIDMPRIREDN